MLAASIFHFGTYSIYEAKQFLKEKVLMSDFVELVRFNSSGLVPSIAQDFKSKQVLMLAWMSKNLF